METIWEFCTHAPLARLARAEEAVRLNTALSEEGLRQGYGMQTGKTLTESGMLGGGTAMEAVYILAGVERAVPEVFASRYDIRYLLNAAGEMLDGEKPDLKLPLLVRRKLEKKIKGTDIELLLKEYNII